MSPRTSKSTMGFRRCQIVWMRFGNSVMQSRIFDTKCRYLHADVDILCQESCYRFSVVPTPFGSRSCPSSTIRSWQMPQMMKVSLGPWTF